MPSTLEILWCLFFTSIAQAEYPWRQLYQFPNSTFTDIENIAIRANGSVLFNVITSPSVYQIDPWQSQPTPQLLHSFPNATSMTGITEISPDVFAVVVGNYTISEYKGHLGTFGIWSIDLNPQTPVVKNIASIPQAQALNGITNVDGSPDIVLIADSALGAIWSLNVTSGQYQIVMNNTLLGPTSTFPLGINGLHTRGRTLYFTNSALHIFASVPISPSGAAEGNISVISHNAAGDTYDDFAFDEDGNAWITTHPSSLEQVTLSGKQLTAANSTEFVQPTSAAFGKVSCGEECILYMVTAGTSRNISTMSGGLFAVFTC